ncbi:hypothetical protein RFI_32323, partial [Reticulomyxa filosa]
MQEEEGKKNNNKMNNWNDMNKQLELNNRIIIVHGLAIALDCTITNTFCLFITFSFCLSVGGFFLFHVSLLLQNKITLENMRMKHLKILVISLAQHWWQWLLPIAQLCETGYEYDSHETNVPFLHRYNLNHQTHRRFDKCADISDPNTSSSSFTVEIIHDSNTLQTSNTHSYFFFCISFCPGIIFTLKAVSLVEYSLPPHYCNSHSFNYLHNLSYQKKKKSQYKTYNFSGCTSKIPFLKLFYFLLFLLTYITLTSSKKKKEFTCEKAKLFKGVETEEKLLQSMIQSKTGYNADNTNFIVNPMHLDMEIDLNMNENSKVGMPI